jgi:hypothetical protein
MLSADVLYDNVPFPDIVGRENVREFHAGFGVGTDFTVEATRIAAAEDVLLNERIRTPTLCLFNKRPFNAHRRRQQRSWPFMALNCSTTRARNIDQKTLPQVEC